MYLVQFLDGREAEVNKNNLAWIIRTKKVLGYKKK